MKRVILPAAALLLPALLLVGCGDAGDADSSSGSPASPSSGGGIQVCGNAAPVTVEADLEGTGKAAVNFTSPSGECPAQLSLGERVLDLAITEPITAEQFSVIRVPGHAGDLILYRYQHPRGGFEARLFAARQGKPVEITRSGGALVPFVATDAPTQYVAATCTDDGFEVIEAEAHRPIGVAAAWDVYSTAFTGSDLSEGAREEEADNVLDEELTRRYPLVARNALFTDCRG